MPVKLPEMTSKRQFSEVFPKLLLSRKPLPDKNLGKAGTKRASPQS
jgi:hypothetical protein